MDSGTTEGSWLAAWMKSGNMPDAHGPASVLHPSSHRRKGSLKGAGRSAGGIPLRSDIVQVTASAIILGQVRILSSSLFGIGFRDPEPKTLYYEILGQRVRAFLRPVLLLVTQRMTLACHPTRCNGQVAGETVNEDKAVKSAPCTLK